jgi:Bacterial Ig-like domain (group 1)
MRRFPSHQVRTLVSSVCFQLTHTSSCRFSGFRPSNFKSVPRRVSIDVFGLTVLAICIAFGVSSFAQVSVTTSRFDNARDSSNTSESLLTLGNVNMNSFGLLYNVPIDYIAMAQPLYMPNVNIPGQGTHNVVYVATQADSVYAFDADTGAQLWWVNYTNPSQGIVTAQGADGTLPCYKTTGFVEEGIPGTPVIDPNTNTMFLVAKTVVNGTVVHNLHAIDITTGADQAGSPVQLAAQTVSNKGHKMVFNSKYQKNRPGLLLSNGTVYIGFGGNSCNDLDSGWVLAYNESTLEQVGVFNTSPDYGLVSIWQTGNGLAADADGNIFFETAESGITRYDVPEGGQTYANSVVKLSPSLEVLDYFTPGDVVFLNQNDLDMSATGVMLLPDQPGQYPHELIASGKQGLTYVLDRDNLGGYSVGDVGALQGPLALVPGLNEQSTSDILFSSPAYWNNTVYFAPDYDTPTAFPLVNGGYLGAAMPSPGFAGSHSPGISANGNSNGILWVISGSGDAPHPTLMAFNALSLQLLYASNQAPSNRDSLPMVGHFVTQTVANGKVYVATRTSLAIYGLLSTTTVTAGGGQSATVATPLAASLQVQASNPYTGQPVVGATINFSDGCKKAGSTSCGTFNPASAVTDSNGNVTSSYTVPKLAGTYTLTASGSGIGNATTTATATAGPPFTLSYSSGAKQTGTVGTVLPNPLVGKVLDSYKNPVPGITVNFTATKGAVVNPTSAVTNASGLASTTIQLPETAGKIYVYASSPGLKQFSEVETAVAGP